MIARGRFPISRLRSAFLVAQVAGLQMLVDAYFIRSTTTLVIRDLPSAPTTTPAARSPSQLLQQNPNCLLIGEALAICGSLSPGFTAFLPTAQAKCLCYSSTSWAPNIFDSAVESCASFASTAVPAAFAAFSNLGGFCTEVGDILGPAVNTDSPLTSSVRKERTDGHGSAVTGTTSAIISAVSLVSVDSSALAGAGFALTGALTGVATISIVGHGSLLVSVTNSLTTATNGFIGLSSAASSSATMVSSLSGINSSYLVTVKPAENIGTGLPTTTNNDVSSAVGSGAISTTVTIAGEAASSGSENRPVATSSMPTTLVQSTVPNIPLTTSTSKSSSSSTTSNGLTNAASITGSENGAVLEISTVTIRNSTSSASIISGHRSDSSLRPTTPKSTTSSHSASPLLGIGNPTPPSTAKGDDAFEKSDTSVVQVVSVAWALGMLLVFL